MLNLLSPRRFSRVVSRGLSFGIATFFMTAGSPAQAAENISIGVSVPTLDNVFWVRAVDFAKHTAHTLGVELVVVGAENKEEKQLNDVQSLISRGVKALVVTPQSTATAPGLIRLANRSNIPIMIVDRYPGFPAKNDKAPYLAFIGPDDVTAGRDIANALINKGATKVVAIGGLPGSSVAEGRQKGLNEAISAAAAKGVKLIQYIGAGESEDKKTNFIYSTGGHWLQVGFGVMIAYDALHGHAPIKDDVRLSLIGVDSANFAKFKQEYIDNPPPFNVKDYVITFNAKTAQQTFPLSVQ
jgi:ABC-type sugar transport system substrate-binding protein